MSGHGQVSSCGEAQHSPCSRHPPTPSATTPTFFLCCESSKGCRRRVRRSQALEDGPQLLLRPPGCAESTGIVPCPPPRALEGPPGLLRPPFPQAAGRRRGSHKGPHRQEKWRQDPRVLPHGHHMSLTTQSTAPSPRLWALLPHPPDASLQACWRGNKEERRGLRLAPPPVTPSVTAPRPSLKDLPALCTQDAVAERLPDSFI